MKKEDAQKWVDALRSGKYKQGHAGLLRDECGGFCCLGVLDDLFLELDLAGLDKHRLQNFGRIGLPDSVCSIQNSHSQSLAGFNDGTYNTVSMLRENRYSFDEIADIIQLEYIEGI